MQLQYAYLASEVMDDGRISLFYRAARKITRTNRNQMQKYIDKKRKLGNVKEKKENVKKNDEKEKEIDKR